MRPALLPNCVGKATRPLAASEARDPSRQGPWVAWMRHEVRGNCHAGCRRAAFHAHAPIHAHAPLGDGETARSCRIEDRQDKISSRTDPKIWLFSCHDGVTHVRCLVVLQGGASGHMWSCVPKRARAERPSPPKSTLVWLVGLAHGACLPPHTRGGSRRVLLARRRRALLGHGRQGRENCEGRLYVWWRWRRARCRQRR